MNSKQMGTQKQISIITTTMKNIRIGSGNGNAIIVNAQQQITYAQVVKDGWVRISKLFEYLKGKSRSEMFQTANLVDRDVKSKYIETYNHNTMKEFIKLRNFLRLYKPGLKMMRVTKIVRDNKFKTEVLDEVIGPASQACKGMINNLVALGSLPNAVLQAVNKAATTMDNITSTSTRFEDVLIQIQGIIKSVANVIDDFKSNTGFLLVWLLKVIAFINLIRQKHNQDLSSIASLITLILPVETGELLLSQITVLPLAVKGIISYLTGFQTEGPEENSATVVQAFFYMIRDMVGSLYSGSDKVKFLAMKLNQDKVRYFVSGLSIVRTLHGYFLELIKMILNYFQIEMINDKTQGGVLAKENFNKFFDEYYDIRRKGIHESARNNTTHAKLIKRLQMTGIDLSEALAKAIVEDEKCSLKPLLGPLKAILTDLQDMIKHIPAHVLKAEETRRNKPYWLYVFGEPRIGKSSFFQPLLVNELVTRLNLTEEYQNLSSYTYFRRCGSEFWDGYTNQLVAWYNDVFQLNSRAEEVIKTIGELTDIVDDNPCVLNMAECDMKDKIYFDSKIVVSNGQNDLPQQQFLANNCWSGGQHILARRNCVVEFCLSPDYTSNGNIGIDKQKMKAAMDDPKKEKISCKGVDLIPNDMYFLRIRHAISGYIIYTVDLVNGINMIVNDMINYMSSQDEFKDRLFGFFKARFDDRDDKGLIKPLQNVSNNMRVAGPGSLANHMSMYKTMTSFKGRTEANDEFDDASSTSTAVDCHCYWNACEMVKSFPPTETRALFEAYYGMIGHQCTENMDDYIFKFMDICREWNTKKPVTPWYQLIYEKAKSLTDSAFGTFCRVIRKGAPFLAISLAYVVIVIFCTAVATYFDNKWSNKKHKRQAQTHENTANYKQQRLIRRKVNTETAEMKQNFKSSRLRRRAMKTESYDEQNVCIEQSIKPHFCRLSLYCIKDGNKVVLPQIANICAVSGNIFVTPKHYYARHQQLIQLAKEQGYELQYEFMTQSNVTIQMPLEAVSWYLGSSSQYTNDLAFCKIARGTAYKDLTRFFLRETESVNLTGCYLYGIRSPLINGLCNVSQPTILPVNQTTIEDVEYDTGEAPSMFGNTTLKNVEYVGVMNYIYNNNHTVKGDCGMLLMHSDSSKNCRKILGMHVAGSPNTNEGVSAPIFAEDIEEALAYFNHEERIITTECYEHMTTEIDEESKVVEDLRNSGLLVVGTLKDFELDGKLIKGRVSLPRTTNVHKSVAFDMMERDYGAALTMPAFLKPTKIENEIISPLMVGMKKYTTHPKYISEKDFEPIKDSVLDCLETARSYPMINRRVLSDFETINGFGAMKQMDMSTSAGYPYCNRHIGGKSYWFDREVQANGASVFSMKDYLKNKVDERIAKAKQGVCAETYYIDSLKDETRPIEKVMKGKTRIFQIGPVDLTIAMRKYFGSFIDFIHSSYIRNEIAVGCNPNSPEWEMKMKKFLKIGNKGWDGDFENYDASIWSQIVDMACDIINAWYHGNKEDNLVRRVLMKTLVFSYHIIENIVFLLFGGNPSGNVLTTILNCLVFMIMIRLFYREKINKDLSGFPRDVATWTFGDDNLSVFNNRIKATMEDARQFFAKYNMVYTSAQKTQIQDIMVKFEDMTFLKRKWTEVEGEIMAPIGLQVIHEIPRWSEGDPTNMENQLQRYNAALLEISNYGRVEFNKMRNTFVNQLRELNEKNYFIPINKLFTYERCYDIKRPEQTKFTLVNTDDLDIEGVTALLEHASVFSELD